jgi:hypothetical protein
MGLDMSLHAKTYVKIWKHTPEEEKIQIVFPKNSPHTHIEVEKVSYIQEEIGYWRKANAIHAWFVTNVQDNNDDCGEYFVSKIKLEELLEIVKQVLASVELVDGKVKNGSMVKDGEWVDIIEDGKVILDPETAKELLPTQSGFFFGSVEYDKWYVSDLVDTLEILKAAIAKSEHSSVYYSSSW